MLDDGLIERARQGCLDALTELDARGLLLGADETPEAYAERLRSLKRNLEEMGAELSDRGTFTLEDLTVRPDARIPPEVFAEAHLETERLYRFRADWVPGFFANPRFGLLFGGCAYYYYPDFFALFIVRTSFARRRRWLVYDRRELLSHELCHVARVPLQSRLYEETFAYRTSTSAFRRAAGSVFRGQSEALLFVGSALALVAARLVRVLALPWFPVWPFWALLAGVALWLAAQGVRLGRVWRSALERAEWAMPGQGPAMLFRCTDAEVDQLSRLPSPEAARAWVAQRCAESLRWQVTRARFAGGAAAPAHPS